jgi:hypothetical protein
MVNVIDPEYGERIQQLYDENGIPFNEEEIRRLEMIHERTDADFYRSQMRVVK